MCGGRSPAGWSRLGCGCIPTRPRSCTARTTTDLTHLYYGAFYRSALSTLLARINTYLVRWIRKKYKRLRAQKKARAAWEQVTRQYPSYFAHWAWVRNPLMIKMAGAE